MTARRRKGSNNRTLAMVLIAGAGAILIGIVLAIAQWRSLTETTQDAAPATPPTADARPAAATEEARKITATLYFVAGSGTELVGVTRDIPYGATSAEQARRIAEAQLGDPPSGLFTAIPRGTEVRSVYLTPRGEAYVDLSRSMISGQAGGSTNEALSVYAMVNAMVVNLPDVSSVQILVEGQEVDSLAGHLDLRHPLRRSSEWMQKGQ